MVGACQKNARQCNVEENVKKEDCTPKERKEDLG
jgi:hypothetical protein